VGSAPASPYTVHSLRNLAALSWLFNLFSANMSGIPPGEQPACNVVPAPSLYNPEPSLQNPSVYHPGQTMNITWNGGKGPSGPSMSANFSLLLEPLDASENIPILSKCRSAAEEVERIPWLEKRLRTWLTRSGSVFRRSTNGIWISKLVFCG